MEPLTALARRPAVHGKAAAARILATAGNPVPPAAKVSGDTRVAVAAASYLDRGQSLLEAELARQGVSQKPFKGQDLRSLSALVGKGLVRTADLPAIVTKMGQDPASLQALLESKRQAFRDGFAREHRIALKDGSSRWTVQEIAVMDFLLSEMPESFKRVVRNGPALKKDKSNDQYLGVYWPLTDQVTVTDDANPGGATLAAAKRSEGEFIGTALMEMAHAWQIRQTGVLNPALSNGVKLLAGIAYPPPDIVSDWSKLSDWTVRPKWSLASLFGRFAPNSVNASGAYDNLSIPFFGGKTLDFSITDLEYDKARESTFVSGYAKTDPLEDFGDSVVSYFTDPEVLKQVSPAKYEYIRTTVMAGKEYRNDYGLFWPPPAAVKTQRVQGLQDAARQARSLPLWMSGSSLRKNGRNPSPGHRPLAVVIRAVESQG